MAIDVSTVQLAQMTERGLGGKVSLDTILEIWHAIGELGSSNLSNIPQLSHLLSPKQVLLFALKCRNVKEFVYPRLVPLLLTLKETLSLSCLMTLVLNSS